MLGMTPDDATTPQEFHGGWQSSVRVADSTDGRLNAAHALDVSWPVTRSSYPTHRCLHELFELQVEKDPDLTAIECDGRQLSYEQLNKRANRLAHYLRAAGVAPEMQVGLCAERSFDMAVAALAILKAGGAFLPLDPAYPLARREFMLRDAQAPLLITHSELTRHGALVDTRIFNIDTDWSAVEAEPETDPVNVAHPLNLAYTIYTSGSTGTPKGIGIQHRNAVSFITWSGRAF